MVEIDEGFDFKYYVCNSKGKLVMGFDDREDALNYASANRYRFSTKENIVSRGIDIFNTDNWTQNYPENGLE